MWLVTAPSSPNSASVVSFTPQNRQIVPARKFPTLFSSFSALSGGFLFFGIEGRKISVVEEENKNVNSKQ